MKRLLLVLLLSLVLLPIIPLGAGGGYDQPENESLDVRITSPAPGARIPEGTETVFQASVQGGVPPYAYSWSFGDGTASSEPAPAKAYQPTSADVNENEGVSHAYTVTLTVKDSGVRFGYGSTTVEVVEPARGGLPLWGFSPLVLLGIAALVLIVFRRRGR